MSTSKLRSTKLTTTSANGSHYVLAKGVRQKQRRPELACVGMVNMFEQQRTTANPHRTERLDVTSSGPRDETGTQSEHSTSQAILEIRRRSGLTWELMSELFNVSRRTVHHWANGRVPNTLHEQNIRKTLVAIKHIDEGTQRATHDRLLSTSNGLSLFELLANRQYSEIMRQTSGTSLASSPHARSPLSKDEQNRRRPTRPELLLGALQDRPVVPTKNARIVRPVKKSKSS